MLPDALRLPPPPFFSIIFLPLFPFSFPHSDGKMSSRSEMASFLGRIAPQLDNHLLLQVVDFYGSKGVDVVAAKKTLIERTKRFDLAENDSSEKAIADLEQNFTRLKNAALPLIKKYFDDKQEEGLVMKISESEIRDIKSKGDQLSIRTIGVPEKIERIRDADKMDVKQFREALVAEFGVSDDKKKVEIKNVTEMRKADETSLRTTQTEVWYIYTQEFRGEVLENNFNAFLEMGQLLFETGSYKDAYEVLNFCRHVMDENHPKYTSTLWGLLASTVLVPAWGAAEEALDQIRTNVTFDIADEDSTASPQDVTVRTRNWMLHWSLFVYFKGGESNSGKFLDVVFDTALRFHSREYNNLHTVETVSPHLLRYVVAACLMNRSKRSSLFHALKIVRVCALDYSDALTQFLEVLIGQANFDEAFAQLSKVEEVIKNDYFLSGIKQQIMDGALKLAYEFYIRTHKEVSIEQVAGRLYPEEASNPATKADANAKSEMWIANLIRDAKVVAKIDSVGGKVDVYSNAVSVHQRIVDRMNQIPRPMMH